MKVKICGLKTKEPIEVAVEHGVDYLGFVFAGSRRRVTPQQVRVLTRDVPSHVKKVGVFVAPRKEQVERVIEQAQLDRVQVHGMLVKEHYSVPLIQAMTVGEKEMDLSSLATEYVLLDVPPKKYVGGNGEMSDWQAVNRQAFGTKKVFIAGGLTSLNVQQAQALFHPYAVDVSSGVERDGEKDCEKIIEFLKKAKEDSYV